MESHPNPRDAWVADAERWITQIHGVKQCKIDLDLNGEVTGVHVVAAMERDPRHVVRDVEGLLKARLGLSVFYKKIGVVQVVENDPPPGPAATAAPAAPPVGAPAASAARSAPPVGASTGAPAAGPAAARLVADEEDKPNREPEQAPLPPLEAVVLEEAIPPRIQCGGVGLLTSERSIKAEVELRAGALEARGAEEGANHAGSDMLLVARAAVTAVRQLIEDPIVLSLSDLRIEPIAGEDVVLATVELVEGRRAERLYGTCAARHSRSQAVVYAVLDALNRRVSLLTFKNAGRGGARVGY